MGPLASIHGLFSGALLVCLFAPAPFPKHRAEPPSSYLGVDVRQGDGGLLITGVYIASPAVEAGLEVDEVIVSLDGTPTPTVTAFAAVLRKKRAGEVIAVETRNGTERRKVEVKLVVRRPYALLGTLQSEGTVVGFTDDSPARKAGLQDQDVILSIGEHKVSVSKDIVEALKHFRAGEVVPVAVRRGSTDMKIPIKLGARPGY